MNTAYLSLGSNEGDRMLWMQQAMGLLAVNGAQIIQKSSVYETAAWGITTQPDFLNMVINIQTTKTTVELLTEILSIENKLGRQRNVKWGSRTIDIDILLYNNDAIYLPGLTIPHPYMQERLFTLIPLAEIAPGYMHPKFHKTIIELLADCPDKLEVHKYNDG